MHASCEHGQADEGVYEVRVRVGDVHGHDLRQTGLGQHARAREEVEGVLAPNLVTDHTPAKPAHHVRRGQQYDLVTDETVGDQFLVVRFEYFLHVGRTQS